MDEFEIEVIGAGPPRKPDGPFRRFIGKTWRLVRALLMRTRLLVSIGAAVFLLFAGTPHAGWDYECRAPMRPGQPCRNVSYCAYYGIQGRRVVFPEYGESCQLVTFLPLDWAKLMGE